MTDHKDQPQSDTPPDPEAGAQARLTEIDLRLGGLLSSLSDGVREIADRLRPIADLAADTVHVDHHIRVGGLAEFQEAASAKSRPAPEHEVRQTTADWTLTAHLPGASLASIRIDSRPGQLTVDTPRHRLSIQLPEDLAREQMEMTFRAETLTLRAPRTGEEA